MRRPLPDDHEDCRDSDQDPMITEDVVFGYVSVSGFALCLAVVFEVGAAARTLHNSLNRCSR